VTRLRGGGAGRPEDQPWRGAGLWRGVGLGRVAGVPVRLDLSWFAGLAVVVVLSRELWAPAAAGVAAVLLSATFAVAFFACVLVHELAHALVARTIGVPTTEIRMFVFGGVARIAGEPVDAGGEALVAMAGPLASVILAGLFAMASWGVGGPAGDLLAWLFVGNLVVAGFNLLPGFPLDGGRVARALVWRVTGRRVLATRVTAVLGRTLAAVLVAGGAGAAIWQQTPRWLPQVVLGLFLWRAAADGERAATDSELLAGRAERG
jgi:Zn-dependent protease